MVLVYKYQVIIAYHDRGLPTYLSASHRYLDINVPYKYLGSISSKKKLTIVGNQGCNWVSSLLSNNF